MIIQQTRGELDTLVVSNQAATAEISLFGAHVLSFTPRHDNRDRLWLSTKSKLDRSRPIRGGIPICWPWFADAPAYLQQLEPNLPAHGYIRTQDCKLVSSQSISDDCDQLVFRPQTHLFPALGFSLALDIVIRVSNTLTVQLVTRNTADVETDFFSALHSYFSVTSIYKVKIEGVDTRYLDKVQGKREMPGLADYTIDSETDRIHLGTSPEIVINDQGIETSISSQGNDSIVIWNPWSESSRNMADMDDSGFEQMLCIETARTQQGKLAPGQTHTLTQIIA